MANRKHIWAVVPAAGQSRRFRDAQRAAGLPGQFKQLVSLGDRSLLAVVIDALTGSRVAGIVVVVNPEILPHIQNQRPANERLHYVVNDRPDSEMIESVQMGIQAVENQAINSQDRQAELAGVLICPGDHPSISTQAVDACIGVFERDVTRLVLAVHAGKRGHPLIIPAQIAAAVLGWPATARLNELRVRYADLVREVSLEDRGILVDVDMPTDLRNVCNESGAAGSP